MALKQITPQTKELKMVTCEIIESYEVGDVVSLGGSSSTWKIHREKSANTGIIVLISTGYDPAWQIIPGDFKWVKEDRLTFISR